MNVRPSTPPSSTCLALLLCAAACADAGAAPSFADRDGGLDALLDRELDGDRDAGATTVADDEVASCRIDGGDVVVCLEWTGATAQPIADISCSAAEPGKTYARADALCSRAGALGSCTMLNQTELFYDEASADKYRESCPRVHGGVWKDL